MDANPQLVGQRFGLLGADGAQVIRDQVQTLARAQRVAVAHAPQVGNRPRQRTAQLGANIR